MQAHQPYFDEIAAGGDAIGNWLSGDVSGPAALDAPRAARACPPPRSALRGHGSSQAIHSLAGRVCV